MVKWKTVWSTGYILVHSFKLNSNQNETKQFHGLTNLIWQARPLCMNAAQDGEYGELVDPFLENQYEPYEMARMVACAAAAVRHSGRRRPKMSQVNNKFVFYYQKST